jgi:hypothetical protein
MGGVGKKLRGVRVEAGVAVRSGGEGGIARKPGSP